MVATRTLVAIAVIVSAACQPPETESADQPAEAMPASELLSAAPPAGAQVTITSPSEGAAVGPDVRITLEVAGIEIRPAGELVEGTAHHHLFLDTDITPPNQPIPASTGQIVHLGTGAVEHTFTGLAPGDHRVIAVLADGLHFPFEPAVTDTVHFTVGGN